ncbi:uncharacterized protein AMSG_11738 [Thecamonas trahens ATCC 50062]|uniref:DUF4200 domain-containing protein n=1 Tax=Thecamonas trahens ATCC 50062 TaxID=461836 RepID=A0A0L0D2N9_THETB|nr:hypothetical protein AMSG_11738 [Thecamonas trahens ATCC 50062]KNC46564.1 hypothetical protein AMSG_11738 [Thecamonas trahens ATCC 50062]|eukprot:XP_013760487.1 hypothetical protein AMSG_11738 [Thecamonas trahens ATCC 50062]
MDAGPSDVAMLTHEPLDPYVASQLGRTTPPEFHFEHMTPATRMLQKRKEVLEVQHALDLEKATFAQVMSKVEEKAAVLEQTKEKLLMTRQNYDGIIMSQDKAYEDCVANIERCNALLEKYDLELRAKSRTLKDLSKRLAKRKLTAERLRAYPEFLSKLPRDDYDFKEESDITERYNTLDSTKVALVEQTKRWTKKHSSESRAIKAAIESQRNEIVKMWTQINRKRKELEELRDETKRLEADFDLMLARSTDETRELGVILMATANLYDTVAKRPYLTESAGAKADVSSKALLQLEAIEQRYLDLKTICNELTALREGAEAAAAGGGAL